MSYNSDNRRVSKKTSTVETNFVWDPESDDILLETDGSNVTQVVFTNELVLFGFSNLVSQRRSSATNYFGFDATGSTRDLTDAGQLTTDSRIYSAFGEAVASSGSTTFSMKWIGQFGYYSDWETGFVEVRRRPFDPQTAQWRLADPLGISAESPNPYVYVSNNPILGVDPLGLVVVIPTVYACFKLRRRILACCAGTCTCSLPITIPATKAGDDFLTLSLLPAMETLANGCCFKTCGVGPALQPSRMMACMQVFLRARPVIGGPAVTCSCT